ncbi:DUF5994 family protein [Nocardia sp. NBC_01329]|uniref:DUF5994 family protein n=1 Tax=Nocardia sp. NBC_01329 TaxID=2903594 RepID=UPI002E148A99|nr:DUF5994 family protein [Nocardia sp. NBC_01329]
MTPQPNGFSARRPEWSARRLRLELDAAGGDADGVWWPHSRDLVVELALLFRALQPGFGPVRRVIYHLDEWSTAPRELDSGGRCIRLDGYRRRPARVLDIVGAGTTLTLRLLTPVVEAGVSTARQLRDPDGGSELEIATWLRARQRTAARRSG